MSRVTVSRRVGTKDRIVRVAADLLAEGGREAVSTRAVAAAAGVQVPTIYRQKRSTLPSLTKVPSTRQDERS